CYRAKSRGLVGRHVFVELHLDVHPEFMGMARTIAQRIEAMIRSRYGPVKVFIYINPEPAEGLSSLPVPTVDPLPPQDGSDIYWN
ncbi:MAG: hypothetical protein F6K29_35090, partial [Okeania sp. SIO2G5]|nr:hypothetical protein [Okeania sp. SIO2G5]